MNDAKSKNKKHNMKLSKMSLAVIAAVSLLALGSSVRAEDPAPAAPTPPPARRGGGMRMSPGEQLKNLTEKLKLTDVQQPKVKAVLEEQTKQRQALRDATPEERKIKGPALREETTKKMKEILTVDQFKQYEEIQKTMGPGARRNADGAAPAPGEGGAKKKTAE